MIDGWGISREIALTWMSLDFTLICQHWFRKWLGAITWAHVDPDRCHHMASLGHNELINYSLASAVYMVSQCCYFDNCWNLLPIMTACFKWSIWWSGNIWIATESISSIHSFLQGQTESVINSFWLNDSIWRHRSDGTKPLPEPMLTFH